MRKKKVLIVIHDFGSGGAQKSLVSFLKGLEINSKINDYEIDVLVSDDYGIFKKDIPNKINVSQSDSTITWMNCPLKNKRVWKNVSLKAIYGEVKWILYQRLAHKTGELWQCWRRLIPFNSKEYDVAISYINGWANYYVMDKVKATKKILWIHNDYQMQPHDENFDRKYYEKCDKIITISEECKNSFLKSFPELHNKIYVLQNITLVEDVKNKARNGRAQEFEIKKDCLKILSVGRLTKQKAFHLAIDAAAELKHRGIDFVWLIIGEGEDRAKLEGIVKKYKLENQVLLPGIKENPYCYIAQCDVFVQTSIYEGKSIVLDEAKVLEKPIVVTDYPTVKASITDMKNGIIAGFNGKDISDKILSLYQNKAIQEQFKKQLLAEQDQYIKELDKYIEIMLA